MAACEKVGVFFALGNDILEARFLDQSELPSAGAVVELKERSLHARITEHCKRPCCANEPTARFRVKETRTFASDERRTLELFEQGRGQEAPPTSLHQVWTDRVWLESVCQRHELCRLFDTYTLGGYLGLDASLEEPHFAVIVDVEKVDA